ncbi:MAG: EAL domain-containing protein [Alphaproteobacteria bacterium]|nr:EAL domain-containing protein [Alphaproteobacteria bacterium]
MALSPVNLSVHKDFNESTSAQQQHDDSFKYLVESAADGIIIQQDYRVVYANPAALTQFGAICLAEVAQRPVLDFIAPNDRPMMKRFLKGLLECGGFSDPQGFRRLRLDGMLIEVVAVAAKISWNGRPALLGIIRNATPTERIQITLQADSVRRRRASSTADQWLWETDSEHRFTFFSEEIEKLGYSRTDIIGKTRWEIADAAPDRDTMWCAHVADLNAHRAFSDFEYSTARPDGIEIQRSVSGVPIFDPQGAFMGYRGSSRDITEYRRAQRTIEHMALHDALTGLPNRVGFSRELERACRDGHKNGTRFAVLFLDLDHFKDVNDTLGHSVGDKLLIEVATRLKGGLRAQDFIARFGGDEFVMLVNQDCDLASINDLAHRLTTTVAVPYDIDAVRVHTAVSIGIALFPDDGADDERIVANADLALYAAKREGRNTWRVFDRYLQNQLQSQRSLDQALRRALDQQQFELHYQPLVSIGDDRILGFEALIRWNHPVHGQVQPNEFIQATERNQLIVPLTEWILKEAITQHQRWASAGLGKFNVSVNVPPDLLKLQGFVDLLDQCVACMRCDPSYLTIEITEGTLIDEAKVLTVLAALRERGVTIAIDDFGKGYSSMTRLKTLPVDVLKIDRTFLANVTQDPSEAMIVELLVKVGQCLGKKVVAEGVETPDQLRLLERIGCDIAQGFFIKQPMAAMEVTAWFERWQSLWPRHAS